MSKRLQIKFCLFFLLIGLVWSSVLPIWEGFDESSHYAYIQYFSEHKELPSPEKFYSEEISQTLSGPVNFNIKNAYKIIDPENKLNVNPIGYNEFWSTYDKNEYQKKFQHILQLDKSKKNTESAGGMRIHEAQQPPLYYLLASPIYILTNSDIFTTVFLIRYFGIIISSIAIVFVIQTITLLFKSKFMIFGIPTFVILNPVFIMNFSRVSNESLNFLLFSLFFYYTVKVLKNNHSVKLFVILGIIIGLGLLTKQSFFAPFAIIPLLIFLKNYQNPNTKNKLKLMAKQILLVFTTVFSISGWWYFINYQKTGNFSGVNSLNALEINDLSRLFDVDWYSYFEQVFLNFWGIFGWQFIRIPEMGYYYFVLIITAVSITGILLFIFQNKSTLNIILKNWRYQAVIIMCLILILLLFGMSYVNFVYFLNIEKNSFTGSWYSFAAATAISIILFGGIKVWLNRFKIHITKNFLLPFFIFMLTFNVYVLFYISRTYYQI